MVKESACECRRHRRPRFNSWVRKIPWRRKWQPLQYSCLKNSMDRGAWWAIVQGVAKESDTTEWLSTLYGDCMTITDWNIYYLVLYTKSVLISYMIYMIPNIPYMLYMTSMIPNTEFGQWVWIFDPIFLCLDCCFYLESFDSLIIYLLIQQALFLVLGQWRSHTEYALLGLLFFWGRRQGSR